jgi:hypothetical protein
MAADLLQEVQPGQPATQRPLMTLPRLLGTLVFVGLIFFSSTKTAGDTSVYAFSFYKALLGIKLSKQASLQFLAQKGIHFTLFFSFGTWLYYSLNLAPRRRLWITLCLCLIMGSASETLQMFTHRHPSILDVLLNLGSGSLAAVLALKGPSPEPILE